MVASRWPYRLSFAASMSFSTSVSVRCSRLRNSLFGRRLRATARFWVVGFTSRRFGFAGIFVSYHSSLLVQKSLYEQYARQFCASLGLLMTVSIEMETLISTMRLGDLVASGEMVGFNRDAA